MLCHATLGIDINDGFLFEPAVDKAFRGLRLRIGLRYRGRGRRDW